MNTEHELFGELHEQEEAGLFGNEHRRQYEAQQEALRLSAIMPSLHSEPKNFIQDELKKLVQNSQSKPS